MNTVFVRESQPRDAEDVYALIEELPPLTQHTPYTYWNLFHNFYDSCFIAATGDELVGFITSHPITTPPAEWFIWQIGVLPEYRGEGIASDLQNRVVEVANRAGASALNVTIEEDNENSLKVFTRMAVRLGSSIEEIDRFRLSPWDTTREVHYRIQL